MPGHSVVLLAIFFPDQNAALLGQPIGAAFTPGLLPAWLTSVSPTGAGGNFAPTTEQAPPSIELLTGSVGVLEGHVEVTRAELVCTSKPGAIEAMKLVARGMEAKFGKPTALAPVLKKLGKPLVWERDDGSTIRLEISPVEQHRVSISQEIVPPH